MTLRLRTHVHNLPSCVASVAHIFSMLLFRHFEQLQTTQKMCNYSTMIMPYKLPKYCFYDKISFFSVLSWGKEMSN